MRRMNVSVVMIKPDAVQRNLVEEIRKKLDQHRLQIIERKTINADRRFIIDLWPTVVNYEGRLERSLVYLTKAPLMIWLVKGTDAVKEAAEVKKEIRKGYCDDDFYTLLHCPDTEQDFLREYKVLFPNEPLEMLLLKDENSSFFKR